MPWLGQSTRSNVGALTLWTQPLEAIKFRKVTVRPLVLAVQAFAVLLTHCLYGLLSTLHPTLWLSKATRAVTLWATFFPQLR